MKILIASDSYKESNPSIQVAKLIEKGAVKVFPDAQYIKLPVADGGEGTMDAIIDGLGGQKFEVDCTDPLGRPVKAIYGATGDHAVMEMASASGLMLVEKELRDPLISCTYGTGQLLAAIMQAGYREITVGIGGSATNDGGAGMARALGYRFLDAQGNEIQNGGLALKDVVSLSAENINPLLKETTINVACDVNNPLLGENGASRIYGPQKGATLQMVDDLDKALTNFADVTGQWKGKDLRDLPGTGAAGGLGFGLLAFCDAQIKSGIETILDLVDFDSKMQGADLVITGEGRIDGQSVHGKVPIGIAGRAQKANIPVLAIVGDIGANISAVYPYGIDSVMSTVDKAMPLEEAIARSRECIVDAAERACRMIKIGMKIKESNTFEK